VEAGLLVTAPAPNNDKTAKFQCVEASALLLWFGRVELPAGAQCFWE